MSDFVLGSSDVIVRGGEWEVGAANRFRFPPEVIDLTFEGEGLEVDGPNVLVWSRVVSIGGNRVANPTGSRSHMRD